MIQTWHLQRYGVSSGAASPRRSIPQNCNVHLSHVLRKLRSYFLFSRIFASEAGKNTREKETSALPKAKKRCLHKS